MPNLLLLPHLRPQPSSKLLPHHCLPSLPAFCPLNSRRVCARQLPCTLYLSSYAHVCFASSSYVHVSFASSSYAHVSFASCAIHVPAPSANAAWRHSCCARARRAQHRTDCSGAAGAPLPPLLLPLLSAARAAPPLPPTFRSAKRARDAATSSGRTRCSRGASMLCPALYGAC